MSVEPWSKWFWTDYEADVGLRMCSLAAQGLWMRMLCLMAKATPKGELRVGGEPCTVAELAAFVGKSEETVAPLLDELGRRGVFSTTRAGVIFNRRLRNDAKLSRIRAEAGAKGAAATNRKTQENSDLPQQKPGNVTGKPRGKSPAPEARSQKLEDKPPSPEPLNRGRKPTLPVDVQAILDEGGYVQPPGDLALLKDWYAAGATLEQDILPVIRRVRPTLSKAPFTLKIFDPHVREKLAADAAEIERLHGITRRIQAMDQAQAAGGAR